MIVLEIVFIAFCLLLVYCFYQLLRNNRVYKIRIRWIGKNDKRWYKYSYDYMFNPSKHNWFGIKYPRDIHFK